MFTAASLTLFKIWKQSKGPPTDEWTEKMWCTRMMEYHTVLRKEGNPTICNNIDGPQRHYANEISQSQKDNYCFIPLP